MAKIEIKNVAKHFGDFTALHSIDLTISDQEFMVLLGASGCGKTTLLRIIAGLETPSQGEVWIGGKPRRPPAAAPARDRHGFSELRRVPAPHRVREYRLRLAHGQDEQRRGRKAGQAHRRAHAYRPAARTLLRPALRRPAPARRRGESARHGARRDLDGRAPCRTWMRCLRLEMRAELKGILADSKTTTIYVTHDQVEAMSLADRISVMHQGRIIQAASPIEIYRNPAAHFVGSFIGNPPMNFLDAKRVDSGRYQVAGIDFTGPANGSDALQFAIRPEDIRVAETGLAASVRVVEPLGPHLLLTCDVAGQSFRAVLESDLTVKAGDVINLQPIADRIRWFDPDSSLALAA